MFIMFFFMMIFMLVGGLFTSFESMPPWAQIVSRFNPVSYLIKGMRMVVLKSSTLPYVLPQLGIIAIFGVVLNSLAVWNYRKTSYFFWHNFMRSCNLTHVAAIIV